jgi:hypothetical protein
MNDRSRTVERRLLLGALVCAVLLIAGYFTFVSTPWGHQLDDDAFFGRKALSRKIVGLDSNFLDLVNKAALFLAAVVLLVIAMARRCTFVGIITVAGFGCAIMGAEVLKSLLPWHALVPDDGLLERRLQADTYPSGHATVGTSLALGLILVSSCRWRPWLAVAGGCISATFSTGVLFTGWHRPSDALGALAWSGLCLSLAAAVASRLRGQSSPAITHPGRAVLGSATFWILAGVAIWLIIAAGVAIWLIITAAAPHYQCAEVAFFVLTELIIASAFTLIAWYGWQLRAIDWPIDRDIDAASPH